MFIVKMFIVCFKIKLQKPRRLFVFRHTFSRAGEARDGAGLCLVSDVPYCGPPSSQDSGHTAHTLSLHNILMVLSNVLRGHVMSKLGECDDFVVKVC